MLNFKEKVVEIFDECDKQATICIFKLPKSLISTKPEAYVPQLIGLGPYHHFRPELHQLQMYKLDAARKIYKRSIVDGALELPHKRFESLVTRLEKEASAIRSCYHMYLDMEDEVLACVVAIDSLALFALLCHFSKREDALQLVDTADIKFAQDSALKDAMMLENQIPFSVVKKIWSDTYSFVLIRALLDCCLTICPLKGLSDDQMKQYPVSKIWEHSHLLGLLYHFIILEKLPEEKPMVVRMTRHQVVDILMPLLPTQIRKPMEFLQGIMEPLSDVKSNVSSALNEAPPVEESLIPRASKLRDVGVNFCLADNHIHITKIKFNDSKTSFYLPCIKIDAFSEVILRNLSAYEIVTKSESEPLILTRYLELMKGLIVTDEDVKVLQDSGVLKSETLSNNEVAKMFGGMNKPTRSTNTGELLDKEIERVNNYYNGLWKVSARKTIKKCWFVVWNFRSVVAAVLLLLLMSVQSFCSVYGCRGIFKNWSAYKMTSNYKLKELASFMS